MIKYLIKDTVELRVENAEDADALHKQMAEEAEQIGAVLTSWNETKKEQKAKGEIIAEWYICKYTLAFNDPKEPVAPLSSITYDIVAPFATDKVPWE